MTIAHKIALIAHKINLETGKLILDLERQRYQQRNLLNNKLPILMLYIPM